MATSPRPPIFGLSTTPIGDIRTELQKQIDLFMTARS
jgi:hypothetical protein